MRRINLSELRVVDSDDDSEENVAHRTNLIRSPEVTSVNAKESLEELHPPAAQSSTAGGADRDASPQPVQETTLIVVQRADSARGGANQQQSKLNDGSLSDETGGDTMSSGPYPNPPPPHALSSRALAAARAKAANRSVSQQVLPDDTQTRLPDRLQTQTESQQSEIAAPSSTSPQESQPTPVDVIVSPSRDTTQDQPIALHAKTVTEAEHQPSAPVITSTRASPEPLNMHSLRLSQSGSGSPIRRLVSDRSTPTNRSAYVVRVDSVNSIGTASIDVEDSSEVESVQFVEVEASRDISMAMHKPCAVVLDDGREVTPDALESEDEFADNILPSESPYRHECVVPTLSLPIRSRSPVPYSNIDVVQTGRQTARSTSSMGVSLYRQRMLEKQHEEARRIQEELECQWQDLTFQPVVASMQYNGHTVDIVNAQPYYQRLYNEAVAKKQRKSNSRAPSAKPQKLNISEKSRELSAYRAGNIVDRLYPDKPKAKLHEPKRVVPCGTREVFKRLVARKGQREGSCCPSPEHPFTPRITEHVQHSAMNKNVVQRLYGKTKKVQSATQEEDHTLELEIPFAAPSSQNASAA